MSTQHSQARAHVGPAPRPFSGYGGAGGAFNFLAGALKRQCKCYRKELKRCQRKFSENAVHQSRVETRRLLSLLELLVPFLPGARLDKIRTGLKRHLDTFDDLRDAHVQLQLLRKWHCPYPEAKAFERHLRKCEKRFDRRTRKDIKRIKTKRLGKWIAACREELRMPVVAATTGTDGAGFSRSAGSPGVPARSDPVSLIPPQIRDSLFHSVDAAFQNALDHKNRIDPERTKTIHRTRIAFKKFRYMVEVLAGFWPIASSRRLAAMHAYQTLMGDVQDLEVLLRAFDKFSKKKELESFPGSGARKRGSSAPRTFRDELFRRREQLNQHYLSKAGLVYSFWPPKGSRPEAAPAARRISAIRDRQSAGPTLNSALAPPP